MKCNRLVTGMCEDRAFLVKGGAESRERGRPRPQQRALQEGGTGILPVFHGRDAHATGVARASCPCFMCGTPMLRFFCSLGDQTAHRNLDRPFTERAGTPALPTAHTQNTLSTRMPPVTNRLPERRTPTSSIARQR